MSKSEASKCWAYLMPYLTPLTPTCFPTVSEWLSDVLNASALRPSGGPVGHGKGSSPLWESPAGQSFSQRLWASQSQDWIDSRESVPYLQCSMNSPGKCEHNMYYNFCPVTWMSTRRISLKLLAMTTVVMTLTEPLPATKSRWSWWWLRLSLSDIFV